MTRALPEPAMLALLQQGLATLEASGLPDARPSAEWLLAAVVGAARFGIYLEPAREPTGDEAERYHRLVARRAAREPLQHLLGFEDFHGLRLAVTPDVLIPRPETEGLVEWAIELLGQHPGSLVADVGTGSGAIACALASRLPDIDVLAIDCSSAALEVARRNLQAHGLCHRVGLMTGDLMKPLCEHGVRVDAVIANLPYLPSAVIGSLPAEISLREPRLALDGGADGMAVLRRLVSEAPAALSPGGWLLMEIGLDQAGPLDSLMAAEGFTGIASRRDLNGIERYIGGRWTAEPGPASAARSAW